MQRSSWNILSLPDDEMPRLSTSTTIIVERFMMLRILNIARRRILFRAKPLKTRSPKYAINLLLSLEY